MSSKEPEWIPPVEPGSKEAYRLVGETFKWRRKRMGISIEEMARIAGMSPEALRKVESGRFTVDDDPAPEK